MKNAGVAELADALDPGSSGQPWGFKSLRPHHGHRPLISLIVIVMGGFYSKKWGNSKLTIININVNIL